jgi:hypothetical protein
LTSIVGRTRLRLTSVLPHDGAMDVWHHLNPRKLCVTTPSLAAAAACVAAAAASYLPLVSCCAWNDFCCAACAACAACPDAATRFGVGRSVVD